jgi:hypothetical protein
MSSLSGIRESLIRLYSRQGVENEQAIANNNLAGNSIKRAADDISMENDWVELTPNESASIAVDIEAINNSSLGKDWIETPEIYITSKTVNLEESINNALKNEPIYRNAGEPEEVIEKDLPKVNTIVTEQKKSDHIAIDIIDNKVAEKDKNKAKASNQSFWLNPIAYTKSTISNNVKDISQIRENYRNLRENVKFAKETKDNIVDNVKAYITLGSIGVFAFSNPVLTAGMGLLSAGMYLSEKFINNNDHSLSKSTLGLSVFATAICTTFAPSFFGVSPYVGVGLGFICASQVKNIVKSIPMAAVGVNVPDVVVGPGLLLGGKVVKEIKNYANNDISDDSAVGRIYKAGMDRIASKVSNTLAAKGFKYFEQLGQNLINSTLRVGSHIKESYLNYRYKDEVINVDMQSKDDEINKIAEDCVLVNVSGREVSNEPKKSWANDICSKSYSAASYVANTLYATPSYWTSKFYSSKEEQKQSQVKHV